MKGKKSDLYDVNIVWKPVKIPEIRKDCSKTQDL